MIPGVDIMSAESNKRYYRKHVDFFRLLEKIKLWPSRNGTLHGIRSITYKGEFAEIRKSTLPIGWYDVIDEYGNDAKVLVFENQLEGYEAFKADVKKYFEDQKTTGRELISKYFRNFGMLPGENELEDLLRYIRQEKEFPELKLFEVRDSIEPFALSEKIKQ